MTTIATGLLLDQPVFWGLSSSLALDPQARARIIEDGLASGAQVGGRFMNALLIPGVMSFQRN